MLQNQIGRFQNISKETLTNTEMLEYFKFSKHLRKVAKFVRFGWGRLNHLSSVKSIKIENERGVCHIKLFYLV